MRNQHLDLFLAVLQVNLLIPHWKRIQMLFLQDQTIYSFVDTHSWKTNLAFAFINDANVFAQQELNMLKTSCDGKAKQ